MKDKVERAAAAAADGINNTNGDGYIHIDTIHTSGKASVQLLYPMKVDFPQGTVTAILGPSGSGKTTLLSTLTDSLQMNIQGVAEVHLPGAKAIVPQDDRLHGFFTVRSYMKHYARLSGRSVNAELETEIDTLLSKLGLTEQANTIVGDLFRKGLSGGQKRRLSIGLEALTRPNNFFLDEPTSGLDAESAFQIMEFLKEYARAASGRRVILTIHQPSSFIWQLIDNVILLSKGRLMYAGDRKQMETFFASNGHPTPEGWNRADHYVTMVNDEFRIHAKTVQEWGALFDEWQHRSGGSNNRNNNNGDQFHDDHAADNGDRKKPGSKRNLSLRQVIHKEQMETYRSGGVTVVIELTYRYFLNLWFNPGILFTRIAMYSMLALMVGALFWNLGDRNDYESILSRAAVSFYCVAFFIFMSVAVLPFTVMERDIVDKEVLNKYYHPIAYQTAQGLATIPGAGLLALLVSVIILTMLNFNDPFWYFLNMFLALLTSEALAQLVSHVVPHFVIGMAMLAGLFGFFMLFQGFMIVPSDFPDWLKWTHYIAFHTYSWRSFMMTEFDGETFDTPQFPTGEDVLKFYEIEDVNRGNDMLVLAGYAVALHLMSFVVLHIRHTLFFGRLELPPPSSPVRDDRRRGHRDDDGGEERHLCCPIERTYKQIHKYTNTHTHPQMTTAAATTPRKMADEDRAEMDKQEAQQQQHHHHHKDNPVNEARRGLLKAMWDASLAPRFSSKPIDMQDYFSTSLSNFASSASLATPSSVAPAPTPTQDFRNSIVSSAQLTPSERKYLENLLKSDDLESIRRASIKLADKELFPPAHPQRQNDETVPRQVHRRKSDLQQQLYKMHEETTCKPSHLLRKLSTSAPKEFVGANSITKDPSWDPESDDEEPVSNQRTKWNPFADANAWIDGDKGVEVDDDGNP
eukprot:CAMPEP_0119555380 /NCGR_PEP_ID=MMETSP1352-20130426/7618_1 /TAXON_ID=265584 /ORGANISM="Stauroneis constricta, Strain CCMP1120" /LENGTH=914 /DNA_ID=CAMNT_0007602133 /DNA_START=1 /DNA_END=2743 /DNA_ORIENTATION=-